MDLESVKTLEDWEKWKNVLHKAVNIGDIAGISEETMSKLAKTIGTFLAKTIDPENREERLLKELWDVADKEDRLVLAKLIIRLVQ